MVTGLLSHVWLFCNPMDCSPPGSSMHRIFQGRIVEWVAISFSRSYLPNPGIKPTSPLHVSCIPGGYCTTDPSGKLKYLKYVFVCAQVLDAAWGILSCSTRDSFLTRVRTPASCFGSTGSWPLDHQGNPSKCFEDTCDLARFLVSASVFPSVKWG